MDMREAGFEKICTDEFDLYCQKRNTYQDIKRHDRCALFEAMGYAYCTIRRAEKLITCLEIIFNFRTGLEFLYSRRNMDLSRMDQKDYFAIWKIMTRENAENLIELLKQYNKTDTRNGKVKKKLKCYEELLLLEKELNGEGNNKRNVIIIIDELGDIYNDIDFNGQIKKEILYITDSAITAKDGLLNFLFYFIKKIEEFRTSKKYDRTLIPDNIEWEKDFLMRLSFYALKSKIVREDEAAYLC